MVIPAYVQLDSDVPLPFPSTVVTQTNKDEDKEKLKDQMRFQRKRGHLRTGGVMSVSETHTTNNVLPSTLTFESTAELPSSSPESPHEVYGEVESAQRRVGCYQGPTS
jgi:hypothetical protein